MIGGFCFLSFPLIIPIYMWLLYHWHISKHSPSFFLYFFNFCLWKINYKIIIKIISIVCLKFFYHHYWNDYKVVQLLSMPVTWIFNTTEWLKTRNPRSAHCSQRCNEKTLIFNYNFRWLQLYLIMKMALLSLMIKSRQENEKNFFFNFNFLKIGSTDNFETNLSIRGINIRRTTTCFSSIWME